MATLDQTEAAAPPPPASPAAGPSSLLLTIIAVATGALVANLYYAQPLIAFIGPELGIPRSLAGALVSVTQLGYGIGLFLIVSLADIVENKRLVMITLAAVVMALVAAALSHSAVLFFLASLVIGISSTGAQVLVPFASHLVPPERRGRTVGNIMAGLLTGILLARPLALFVAAAVGWRPVFWLSAGVMLVIGGLLLRIMPRYVPRGGLSYGRVLLSMVGLVRSLPELRRRAAYQALVFAAFSLFWTAAPLMLAQRFQLSQQGIALFALAGVGGALAAPLAGRLADRGHGQWGTAGAMAALGLAFLATCWAVPAGALIILTLLAIVIDGAVQFNQIISQRILFTLAPEVRGRVNALYMTATFFGGAIGSTLATLSYQWNGWTGTAEVGALLGLLALLLFATEFRRR
jgi:predicted MFS family arabinose efflux permease